MSGNKMWFCVGLAACQQEPEVTVDDPECGGAGAELTLLARSLTFERQVDGVSDGFDLDGVTTDEGDRTGCGVPDLVDNAGNPGVDNALSGLLPLLDLTEASVLEDLVAESVRNGALLLMATLSDVDDEDDDTCVGIEVKKGLGVPMIGNDGEMLPNQTLRIDTSATSDLGVGALESGVYVGGPIGRITLPIVVLDLNTTLEIFDAYVRIVRGEDGVWRGQLAGGIAVEQLTYVASLQNISDEVYALIAPVLLSLADLAPDENGTCQQLSVSLNVEMVPAFVYDGL